MTKCKCDLRTKLVGDGCRYCNPQDYIDNLHDAIAEKSEWVGLTDEEAQNVFSRHNCTISKDLAGILARAIKAKLKEKNNA